MTQPLDLIQLAQHIKQWGQSLGFQQVGICDTDLSTEEPLLQQWLDKQYHGEMAWMAHHGMMRARPHELLPGTLRVISVRMNYLPPSASFAKTLRNPQLGYVSRYALGRDYHKLLRQRLKKLGEKIQEFCTTVDENSTVSFRPFVDSAPIMERPLASKAGIGWVGKHSLILNRDAGSWFFLGELLIDLPLPIDTPQVSECGRCTACITTCPTQAIVAPGVVDARRCISYLTIEHQGVIPESLRPLMGNRIYGCDDCQLICPWNRFASLTEEADFTPRTPLLMPELITLFSWTEQQFLRITEGSAIRRIGYLRWLRNIAIALGNGQYNKQAIAALQARYGENELLDVHITWALEQLQSRCDTQTIEVQTSQQKRLIRSIEKGLLRDA
jgi:epoxyqueuosine reductase